MKSAFASALARRWITWLAVFFCLPLASRLNAQNLVVNPGFEDGAVAFASDYLYSPQSIFDEGTYAVATSPSNLHPYLASIGDHTSGSGNMLVVNGATAFVAAVWRQTVTLEKHQNYLFSVWASNVAVDGPGTLVFRVNGVALEPQFTLPNGSTQWKKYVSGWNSGELESAALEIVFTSTQEDKNDSALDDVSFEKSDKMPSLHLKFDENSGGVAADATGNGWDGALVGGSAFAPGKINNAVNLSGTDQFVTLPAGVIKDCTAITIAA